MLNAAGASSHDKCMFMRKPHHWGGMMAAKLRFRHIYTKSDLFERFVQNAFGGSTSEIVMHALGNEKTSEAEIDAIKAFIARLES
jgi:predicted transcriptional regulator